MYDKKAYTYKRKKKQINQFVIENALKNYFCDGKKIEENRNS